MFVKFLARFTKPSTTRDYATVSKVSKSLQFPAILVLVALGAHPFLAAKASVAATVILTLGALYMLALMLTLKAELKLRSIHRSRRLALPVPLAEGIAAGERADMPTVAKAIGLRLGASAQFSVQSLQVFDCLMNDILVESPSLADALREYANGPEAARP